MDLVIFILVKYALLRFLNSILTSVLACVALYLKTRTTVGVENGLALASRCISGYTCNLTDVLNFK